MKQWFYLSSANQSIGPIPEADLRAAIQNGTLTLDTYVWDGTPAESGGAWVRARDSALVAGPARKPKPAATTAPVPTSPTPTRKRWRGIAVPVALLLLVTLAILYIASTIPQSNSAARPQPQPVQTAKPSISDVADKILPSTVTISVVNSYGEKITGSGFFVTKEGDILTNEHVIEDASKIDVITYASKTYAARIRAYDKERDMALLTASVPQREVAPLVISSVTPRPGMEVVVAGSPLGFEQTISSGIVSAVRNLPDISLIQITAPISPGSSGGPVVNMNGEVIGISTMIMEDSQNLNFAVSAKHLAPFVPYAAQRPPQKLAARRTEAPRTPARQETRDNVEDRVKVFPRKRAYRVTATNLNCREYPTPYSDVLDILPEDAIVYALGTYTHDDGTVWYYVEHDYGINFDEWVRGWVHGRYIELY